MLGTMILLCQLDQTYRHRVKYNQSSSLSPVAEINLSLSRKYMPHISMHLRL